MAKRAKHTPPANAPSGNDHGREAIPSPHMRQLGHELLRQTESFGWISRNGHDIILHRGDPREIFGRELPAPLTFDHILQLFAAADRARIRRAIIACLSQGEPWEMELSIDAPGKRRILHVSGSAVDIEGRRYLAGTFRNIDALHRVRRELARESREKMAATRALTELLDVLPNAIAAYDADDRLIYFNRQYRLYYDKAAPAIRIGESYDNILRYAVEHGQYANIDPAKARSREWMRSRLERHKKGMKRDLVQQLSSGRWVQVRERKSKSGHTVFISTDITSLKQAERLVRRQAETDPLTGLRNRAGFMEAFASSLQRRRKEDDGGCFILFDLDHFKSVNDIFGHHTGDELLQAIAERLRDATRSSDLLARLGGDEFAVFLPDVDAETCELVAGRIHGILTAPMRLSNRPFHPGVSMGVALVGEDAADAEAIVRRADTALFQAKAAGRNQYRHFDQELQKRRERRRFIVEALRHAMHAHAIRIELQPQVSLLDGRHAGFEVLGRWHHDGEDISPMEFISIAEEEGLILELGHIIMKRALGWLRDVRQRGLNPGRMAVNISPVQLKCHTFIDSFCNMLEEHGLHPADIEIEVTETAIIGRDESLIEATLHRLEKAGFAIALDDFGTGNATFSHLKRFPIHRLKIDKTFIEDIGHNPDSTIITQAIINLGHNLGMEVVAEGIETAEQRSFLRISGCDVGQGYLFSRPLSEEAAIDWLRKDRPPRRKAIGMIA